MPTLIIDGGVGYPGSTTELSVAIDPAGASVIGMLVEVEVVGSGMSFVGDESGLDCGFSFPGVDNLGILHRLLPEGCENGGDCSVVRSFISTAGFGPIAGGYHCKVAILPTAEGGERVLRCRYFEVGNRAGELFEADCVDGVITVVDCLGDCSFDGTVDIGELVGGVSAALGQSSACAAWDPDQDGAIGVSELITGVRNSLDGCDLGR